MSTALVWFRRDLRSFDHAALHRALRRHERVHCLFVFDVGILDALQSRCDRRVEFIWRSVVELDGALDALSRDSGGDGAGVLVRHGRPEDIVPAMARMLGVDVVCTNRDYEPAAITRDRLVAERLEDAGVAFESFKDQVIFEQDEILTRTGSAFSVFTPYRNAWLRALLPGHLERYDVAQNAVRLAPKARGELLPDLGKIGFEPTNLGDLRLPAGMSGGLALFADFCERIDRYKASRDYPAVKGVSYLSVHLRFGTVSIRELAAYALAHGGEGAQTWLNELVWRDFYHMILWHHPHVVERSFRPEFDRVVWDDDIELFDAWREARTGYPIVDAAMRQLHSTGFMHNRLRMIVASFLTKDLGIDWRLGERHFAMHLNDFDLAANNGGWQWAASTGCDAQPWFRIFNPVTQSERFDPEGAFIRRYLPELANVPNRFIHAPWKMGAAEQASTGVRIGQDYPGPCVDHAAARARTLDRFAVTRNRAPGA